MWLALAEFPKRFGFADTPATVQHHKLPAASVIPLF
jgi:hypothetical protein